MQRAFGIALLVVFLPVSCSVTMGVVHPEQGVLAKAEAQTAQPTASIQNDPGHERSRFAMAAILVSVFVLLFAVLATIVRTGGSPTAHHANSGQTGEPPRGITSRRTDVRRGP